ncbi:PilW family protein [Endozoicomonas sp. SM1973]|uniref:PilW family protein n=1 Tax=Spartinivicinus marinus TaxID=2994442 RepID=A0A853I0L6_9GAMM|nr:PilW family protein [Spartinivicinus marinus]MCX4027130.1 PilW family protein [Spartinivicinus marinus]NYZ66149.1 PilW family protein [Spartinivicinus marinus]
MNINKMLKNKGFTIIEMMISLVLGALLLGGIISLFTNNQQTYRIIQGTANLQDNARFAVDLIGEDIRMAGYMGCLSNLSNISLKNVLNNTGDDFAYQFNIGIEGFNSNGATWAPVLPAFISGMAPAPEANTDVIVIRRVIDNGASLVSNNPSPSEDMKIEDNTTLEDDEIVIISDCTKATLFQVTSANIQKGTGHINLTHNAGGKFTPGNKNEPLTDGPGYNPGEASIYKFVSNVYYIGRAQDTNGNNINNNQGNPVLSLWRRQAAAAPVEILRGVENLQILYGVDTTAGSPDGTIDQYQNASAVADFNRVITARVELTVNSIDAIGTQGDGVLRRTFSHTVRLRNRGS